MNWPQHVIKILSDREWAAFQAAGVFHGSAVDVADGYIHFSTTAQVNATLAKHFKGQNGLMGIVVSARSLGDALRWEPARGGDLFPHLYAPLPLSAVRAQAPITDTPAGPVCPQELLQWA